MATNIPGSTSSSSGSSSGGGLALNPSPVIGTSPRIIAAGDSQVKGNGGSDFSLVEGYRLKLRSRLRGAGVLSFTDPTFTNSAVTGQTTHDLFITNVVNQLGNPVSLDGDAFLIQIGTNDVNQQAGGDGAGPFTLTQSMANYKTGLDWFVANRPNSHVFLCSLIFCNGELWTRDSTGAPTGGNTIDPSVRAYNAALKTLVSNYDPTKFRFIDLYTPIYAAAASINTANASSGILTQTDGTHFNINTSKLAAEVFLSNVTTLEHDLPTTITPASRWEVQPGYSDDWETEAISYFRSLKYTGAPANPPLRLNRWKSIPVSNFPTGNSDGNIEGGAVVYSGAGPFLFTPGTVYQGPNGVNPWLVACRVKVSTVAASRTTYFGLCDATATDAIGFGINQTSDATHFGLASQHGATKAFNVGGAPMASDNSVHDVFFWYTGSATNLYELMVDRTHLANLAPGADFPQTPQCIGQWGNTNGGTMTVLRVLYMWAE